MSWFRTRGQRPPEVREGKAEERGEKAGEEATDQMGRKERERGYRVRESKTLCRRGKGG